MSEIFVPILHGNDSFLYKVEVETQTGSLGNISICGKSSGQGYEGINTLVEKIISVFGRDISVSVDLCDVQTGKYLSGSKISSSTQSITLGLLVAVEKRINHRSFLKDDVCYVITGDIDKGRTCGVSDIDRKYNCVKEFSEDVAKTLFIYVNGSENIRNVSGSAVLEIKTGLDLIYVYPEVFRPEFDSYQTHLFNKINERSKTDVNAHILFQKIKTEIISNKELKGLYLSGPKASLRNVYAEKICEYLVSVNKVRNPVWMDCTGFSDTMEWFEKEIESFLYSGENGECSLKDLHGSSIVFVFSNIPCGKIFRIMERSDSILSKYRISAFSVFTSDYEPAEKDLLYKDGIQIFSLKRDYSLFLRRNGFLISFLVALLISVLTYWNINFREKHLYYKDIVVTENGISGLTKISRDSNFNCIYDFTYRKKKLIRIDYINIVDNKNELSQILNLISFSSIGFDYTKNGNLYGISFYDMRKNMICSYDIEKLDNSVRLNLRKVNSYCRLDYFTPWELKSDFLQNQNIYNLLKVNSLVFVFEEKTGYLSDVSFYKYHNSFERVESSFRRCGYRFKTDENGNVTEQICLTVENTPEPVSKNSSSEVCRIKYEHNEDMLKISYLNGNAELVQNENNWAVCEVRRSDGAEEKTFYDEHGKIISFYLDTMNSDGRKLTINEFTLSNFSYDFDKRLSKLTMRTNDKKNIYLGYEYDKEGRIVKQSFLDGNELPMNTSFGYAYTLFRYDQNEVHQSFFDSAGNTCDNSSGISEIHIYYDEDNNIISQKLRSNSKELLQKSGHE